MKAFRLRGARPVSEGHGFKSERINQQRKTNRGSTERAINVQLTRLSRLLTTDACNRSIVTEGIESVLVSDRKMAAHVQEKKDRLTSFEKTRFPGAVILLSN